MAASTLVSAAHAQAGSGSGVSAKAGEKPVCMARPQADVPQVKAGQRGRDFVVVAAPRSVPGFEAKGFRSISCGKAGFASPGDYADYRDRVCTLASSGNEAVQNQFELALGERASVLCANAEWLAGRWDRKRNAVKLKE